MGSDWPRGLLGAAGGVAGAIPLLPLARTFASRVFSLPRLPGAALQSGDIKEATYMEVAVLLLALPAAALVLGHLLPRLLETRAGFTPALSEWPGAGFGLSLVLWRSGAPAKYSLLGGVLAGLLFAVAALLLSRGRADSAA